MTGTGIERKIITAARKRLTPPTAWVQHLGAAIRMEGSGAVVQAGTVELGNCWCMWGALWLETKAALRAESPNGKLNGAEVEDTAYRAAEAVAARIPARAGGEGDGAPSAPSRLAEWQDRPERTHAEVLEVLDEAAA